MKQDEIVQQLIGLLEQTLDSPPPMSSQTALLADLRLESIQVIEYLCDVEDHFDLVIDEDRLADVQTISDLAGVVLALSGK
jgi:acyl carrier protein